MENINQEELKELSKPIIEWLLKNYDCMHKVIIQDGKIEVVSCEIGIPVETKMD